VERDRNQIAHLRAQVRALSPQNTLDRGYAVVQLPDGSVLRDAADAPPGTRLRVRVAAGEVAADVVPDAGRA
jgi:exodeoxyribonuclease VII large subunit